MNNESSPPMPAEASVEPASARSRRTGRGTKAGAMPSTDDLVQAQASDTLALVASMPHNANKALDFGHGNALSPPAGLSAESASPLVSASTLSERTVSANAGGPLVPGGPAIDGRLAQARVDGSKQV